MIFKYSQSLYLFFQANVVNPSMKICVETDATNPNSNEIRKVNRSDHLHLFAEKMVQIKQNTSQPIKQENKK